MVRPFGGIALNTGLDLSVDTSYTFEFYVKCTEEVTKGNVHFCIGFLTDGSKGYDTANGHYIFSNKTGAESTVFVLQNDGKRVGHIDEWACNTDTASAIKDVPKSIESIGFWKSGENETGYTRIVMTYEKGKITIYSGNDALGSFNLGALTTKLKDIAYYKKVNLAAGFYNCSVATKGYQKKATDPMGIDADVLFADMKDISIYSGAHTPQELDAINTAKIVGWQDKDNGDNAKMMRIIGGIYDLTGDDIGFDVLVEYKDADGNAQQKKFRRMSENALVYTSILADGETVTAASKGVNYLFAIVIDDIPVDEVTDLQFTVAPFKLIGEERVFGAKKNFTMEMNPK